MVEKTLAELEAEAVDLFVEGLVSDFADAMAGYLNESQYDQVLKLIEANRKEFTENLKA